MRLQSVIFIDKSSVEIPKEIRNPGAIRIVMPSAGTFKYFRYRAFIIRTSTSCTVPSVKDLHAYMITAIEPQHFRGMLGYFIIYLNQNSTLKTFVVCILYNLVKVFAE